MNHRRHLLAAFAAVVLLALPASALAETWTNAALVDGGCMKKVKDDPDAHTRDCALKCASAGFGLFTADGRYLKFDDTGNEQALAALKGTDKRDHLRVDVKGTLAGDTIAVESLALTR
jgi:hypothetical protein